MKLNTLYVSKNCGNKEYVIVNMYNDQEVCFSFITKSELARKLEYCMDTLISQLKIKIDTQVSIENILEETISKESGDSSIWYMSTGIPIWMNVNDFQSNFKEVEDENRLSYHLQSYIKGKRN